MEDRLPTEVRDLVLDSNLWMTTGVLPWIVNEVVDEAFYRKVTRNPEEVHRNIRTKVTTVITMTVTVSLCHLQEMTLARRPEA
jgi:hypothetical protein